MDWREGKYSILWDFRKRGNQCRTSIPNDRTKRTQTRSRRGRYVFTFRNPTWKSRREEGRRMLLKDVFFFSVRLSLILINCQKNQKSNPNVWKKCFFVLEKNKSLFVPNMIVLTSFHFEAKLHFEMFGWLACFKFKKKSKSILSQNLQQSKICLPFQDFTS